MNFKGSQLLAIANRASQECRHIIGKTDTCLASAGVSVVIARLACGALAVRSVWARRAGLAAFSCVAFTAALALWRLAARFVARRLLLAFRAFAALRTLRALGPF